MKNLFIRREFYQRAGKKSAPRGRKRGRKTHHQSGGRESSKNPRLRTNPAARAIRPISRADGYERARVLKPHYLLITCCCRPNRESSPRGAALRSSLCRRRAASRLKGRARASARCCFVFCHFLLSLSLSSLLSP